jgi:hypothetical protein
MPEHQALCILELSTSIYSRITMSLREGPMRFLVLLIATASAAWGQSVSAGSWNLTGASGPASSSTMSSLVSLPDSSLLSWDTTMANSPQSTLSNICVGTLANPGAITCNTTYTVANYQTALNNAACGQTIIFQNTTYGAIVLPRGVNCPANNWVIVTRDTTDTTFPAEGQRVDPCFHGVPHSAMTYLPYPTWDTSVSCARHMPQFKANTQVMGLGYGSYGTTGVSIAHWRFVGLEVTRGGASDASLNYDLSFGLVSLFYQPTTDCVVDGNNNPINATACMKDQPTNIIFDRMVVHGDPIHQTTRAFDFGGSRFVAVIDSYVYDVGLTYAGGGGDSQVFAWGYGKGFTNVGWGKFVNNFGSSSTMSSLFCGAFVEPVSPVTGQDGVPQSAWFAQDHFYKNPLWDTQIGQTLNETVAIEGQSYGPSNDQEVTIQPAFIQLQLGQQFQLQETILNGSDGGLNRITPGAGASVAVDGVTNGNSTTGLVTKNTGINVGSGAWLSANQNTWTYVACSGSGTPIAACTGATTAGSHSVVFSFVTHDARCGGTPPNCPTLGNSRTITATSTITVTSGTPTKQIAVSPAAPDLSIQPSYSDSFFNSRTFCYTFFEFANYIPASITWSVDGVTGGNSTVGTVTTPTGVGTGGSVYCSGTATGIHNVTATASDGTTNSSPINVSTSAPILGYDLKTFTQKNGWELKCGRKILLEKSLVEVAPATNGNGGGQPGTDLLLQVINQAGQSLDGSGVNVGYGPEYITDITIDHNQFAYAGKGPSVNALNSGLGTHRVQVSNNVFDDTNYERWGHGWFAGSGFTSFQMFGDGSATVKPGWTSPTSPVMDNVTWNHNTLTGIQGEPFNVANNLFQYTMINLKLTNNIVASVGSTSFINTNGEGGDCNAAVGSGSNNTEVKALVPCWSPYTFNFNALTDSTASPSVFTSSPIWQPASSATDLFANYNGGKDGDYRVCTGVGAPVASCTAATYAAGGVRQANDGTALGADVVGVNAAVAAVKLGTRTP